MQTGESFWATGTIQVATPTGDYLLSRYPLLNWGCRALKLENDRSKREERTSPTTHRALCIQRELGRVVLEQRNSEWYKETCPEWRNHANCLHQSWRTPPKMKREKGALSRAFSVLRLIPFVYLLLIQTGRRPEGSERVWRRDQGFQREGRVEGQNAFGTGGGERAQLPWEASQ